MAVNTYDLARHLRLPPDTEEPLYIYLRAAVEQSRNAGVPVFENNAQYDLFILDLAAELFENRAFGISGAYPDVTAANIQRMINANVLQLRHSKDGEPCE